MEREPIIPDILKTFDYYKSKLPLYLQNDTAFLQHFKIWFDFLVGESSNTGVAGTENTLLDLINIFDDNYLELINSLKENPADENETSNILDKLGNIFNIKRNFSVSYGDPVQSHNISLNDSDFIIFIKAQIIKNYSDGSYKQMREFYDKSNIFIYFKSEDDSHASVEVYLLDSPLTNYSDDIKYLFYAGLLTIESMGITYRYSETDYREILVWSESGEDTELGWGDYNENPSLVSGGKLAI